jgi:hypothetical protein
LGHLPLAARRPLKLMLLAARLTRNCRCLENKLRCKNHFVKLAFAHCPSLKNNVT